MEIKILIFDKNLIDLVSLTALLDHRKSSNVYSINSWQRKYQLTCQSLFVFCQSNHPHYPNSKKTYSKII